MKLIHFKNEPKQSPFAPEWSYFLGEEYFKNIDFIKLKNCLLKQEKNILKLPIKNNGKNISPDGYTNLGENSTTSRHGQFNVFKLKNSEIPKLKKCILNLHNVFLNKLNVNFNAPVYINSWFNIMRKGQFIDKHLHSVHPDCYLSGNICVSCNKTSTFYISPINQINDPVLYESKNEIGKAIIFQSNIPHYTNKHNDSEERITIAFDLLLNKPKDIKHIVKLK